MKAQKVRHTKAALALGAAVLLGAAGCASGKVTESLSGLSSAAEEAGMDGTAAVLGAGAAVSRAAEDITQEESYYIGRAVAATILTNYTAYESAAAETYLNEICGILVLNSDVPEVFNGYHVKILDSDEVNAFSTSGGHILVTRGLLACADSEDALAAVIAHEIAHIQLAHSLKAIKASRFTDAATATASAAATAAGAAELASTMDNMVGDVVSNMVNSGYSQKQEFAADKLALQLMAEAGYEPSAMEAMLTKMKEHQNSSSAGFYKTHPSPDKRISNIKGDLKKLKVADTTAAREPRFKANGN